jgi:predicted AAA+ superfamily ATPase
MFKRDILKELEKNLLKKQILAITGLRRVGKTTIVKYLFERIKSKNKFYFDLERLEHRKMFSDENYGKVIEFLKLEGADFSSKLWIVLDEIQLVPNITSLIKYLYDQYEIKFIITGSSSFYMKGQFSDSLAGRKILFELWPLSFSEFLDFKQVKVTLPPFEYRTANEYFVNRLKSYYDEYCDYGGFPEVVLAPTIEDKKLLLEDILESYIKFDVLFLSDFTKADELFSIIKLLSSRVGSKIDYSKISSLTGINRHKVKDYILFLENTFFIRLVPPFVKNPDREIALQKKIYFTDSGILNISGKISSGALFENTVAHQLSLKGKLQYYAKKSGQEIDFILNENKAFEVKETPTQHDLKILKNRAGSINMKEYYLIGKTIPPSGFTYFIWGGNIY